MNVLCVQDLVLLSKMTNVHVTRAKMLFQLGQFSNRLWTYTGMHIK